MWSVSCSNQNISQVWILFLFHSTGSFHLQKHTQNKIGHTIILWMLSMTKLRGHKRFRHYDCHDEAYSLTGKTLYFYLHVWICLYLPECLSFRQSWIYTESRGWCQTFPYSSHGTRCKAYCSLAVCVSFPWDGWNEVKDINEGRRKVYTQGQIW